MVVGVILLVAAAAAHRTGYSWAAGGAGGLLIGLRAGTWWAFMRLGEYERKQRGWRARNWLGRTGG